MKPLLHTRGSTLIAALFLLVFMAIVASSLTRVQTQTALGEVSSLQSQRAWAVARSAILWAVARSKELGCSPSPTSHSFSYEGFAISTECESAGYAGTDNVQLNDGSDLYKAYVIDVEVVTSNATPGEPGYAKRSLRTSVIWDTN